jgi:hypothetical protein
VSVSVSVCPHTHTHTHIYIYIYILVLVIVSNLKKKLESTRIPGLDSIKEATSKSLGIEMGLHSAESRDVRNVQYFFSKCNLVLSFGANKEKLSERISWSQAS